MSSVEVILKDISANPSCPHGPTVLFARNGSNFYACAACRDRKDCNFFLPEDQLEKFNAEKKKLWAEETRKYVGKSDHRKLFSILNQIKGLTETKRAFCMTCTSFELEKYWPKHANHKLITGISDLQLNNPSVFLPPLDNPKKEAQFLFAAESVKVIADIIETLKYTDVICMGTPRIYEFLRNTTQINSLLLDFDRRYQHFFGPLDFCWYNCFNHHFFTEEGPNVFGDFVGNASDLFLVLDPPFGGRVELLANTIRRISKSSKRNLGIFFIFPYFMEPQILNSLPEFRMLDYKVDYENHPLFQDGAKGRKLGSPVRIFTNLDPSTIDFSTEDGYKYCQLCERSVAVENIHCNKCQACTSKDGSSYVHCDICQRCVKPTWRHCNKCQRCAQVDHKCGEIAFVQKCFHCNTTGHKKRDCPKVSHDELREKRKISSATNLQLKKLKKRKM